MASYRNGTVTVGATATAISTSASPSGTLIQNNGAVPVYLGGSTVTGDQTVTGGVTLTAGASITIPATGAQSEDLYGIVATGTAKVAWLAVA